MTRAFIPFLPEFHALIRSGRKTATTRSKAYGKPGDIVDSPVGPLRLVRVMRVPLETVARDHYREEGFDMPGEFEAVWCRIHPRRGFVPSDVRVLHVFEVTLDA